MKVLLRLLLFTNTFPIGFFGIIDLIKSICARLITFMLNVGLFFLQPIIFILFAKFYFMDKETLNFDEYSICEWYIERVYNVFSPYFKEDKWFIKIFPKLTRKKGELEPDYYQRLKIVEHMRDIDCYFNQVKFGIQIIDKDLKGYDFSKDADFMEKVEEYKKVKQEMIDYKG